MPFRQPKCTTLSLSSVHVILSSNQKASVFMGLNGAVRTFVFRHILSRVSLLRSRTERHLRMFAVPAYLKYLMTFSVMTAAHQ